MSPAVFIRRYSCILLLLLSSGRGFGADVVTRLGSATAPSSSANSDSTAPIVSADGNFVAFTSQASNLSTNDTNGSLLDVFLRDLFNGVTTLVSVTADGAASGNGISIARGISSDNQMVVFESRASNLVANDTNNANDVFLRNRGSGTTTLVSVNRFGTGSGNGSSTNPEMTPDGRFVVFESAASDLVENDTNGAADVFLRDLELATTILVSVQSNGVFSANGPSTRPSISANGQVVAFASRGSNLAAGNQGVTNDLYFRDLPQGITRMVDLWHPGVSNVTVSTYSHVLSADGRFLALQSHASRTNLGGLADGVYYCDLVNATNTLVAATLNTANSLGRANLSGPTLSADGQVVAFEAKPTNTTSWTLSELYVWEASTGISTLVYPVGNAPLISGDGSRVAFMGFDTNNLSGPQSGRQLFVHHRASGTTELVTVDKSGNPASDAEFPAVSLSADGRTVAFQSRDDNLVANDDNRAYDVFVRDLDRATTTLVSRRAAALPSLTGFGPSSISANSVSADGRYVVFVSEVAGLVANDTNGLADVFVRDLVTDSNILVSATPGGSASGNGMSRDPVISVDGRYVAFVSAASDLASNDTNALDDVFLRDLQTGSTLLTSIDQDHTASASGTSSKPSLSADGRFVVFQSRASDVVTNDFNGQFDVFVFDATTGSNRLVSLNSLGVQSGNGTSEQPVVTRGGEWVIFQSRATDLLEYSVSGASYQIYARNLLTDRTIPVSRGASFVSGPIALNPLSVSANGNWVAFMGGSGGTSIYLCELGAGTNVDNVLVASGASSPSISSDGRFIVFCQFDSPTGRNQVWVLDRQTAVKSMVSVRNTGGGGGNGDSTFPVISGDGRYVVFKSQASDLAGNDTNGWSDIFVRDLVSGTTLLASVNASATSASQLSSAPVLGADGRTVLFQSFAADLSVGDRNNNRDVFLLRLGAADSDNDGLPDDWEVTYFGDLSHSGSGDSDGDGLSDLAEYRAGTSPTSDVSVLRVLSITAVGMGGTTIIWSAVSGKTYRVQYKDDLSAGWTDLLVPVTIENGQGSAVDSTSVSANTRFYRAVVLP